jgi:hypothetical protein
LPLRHQAKRSLPDASRQPAPVNDKHASLRFEKMVNEAPATCG